MPTLYIESDITDHPRTENIVSKFHEPRIITIQKYTEIFNRKNQSFRKQKDQGNHFIIAKKRENFIQEVPEHFALETKHNYYFSTSYNCPFDCEYCVLQGKYRSAYPVFFVNFDDYQNEISSLLLEHHPEPVTLFAGYENDSLGCEPYSGFTLEFVPWFAQFDNVVMELRTKGANIVHFEKLEPTHNTVIAWTLSPTEIQEQWEHKTATLEARVQSLVKLQQAGWKVGIRIEPLIYFADWKDSYSRFFDYLEQEIDFSRVENIYFGQLRLPQDFFKQLKKMHPESTLFTKYYELQENGEISYPKEKTEEMFGFVKDRCEKLLNNKVYQCNI